MKINLKEIQEQYPDCTIAQSLVSYLEDKGLVSGAVGMYDPTALIVFFLAATEISDPLEFIESIRTILVYEQAGVIDKAWEEVSHVLETSDEESEEEQVEGMLGL